MKKHFVIFCSPGTFVDETTSKPIDSWNVDAALKMVDSIVERYNATPFGFYFSTRERGQDDLDSRETATSPMYFLGGKVETLAEVEARNDPKEEIPRSNMRGNGYDRIITNTNSWKTTRPLHKKDVVLDYTPKKRKAA